MTAETTNQYEAMFLLPAGASPEVEKKLSTIRGMIERHGGQIIVLKKWDERKLAYELRGNKRGLYIICYFRAQASAVVGIERDVNLSEEILRVLVTKADHLTEEEMAAVQPQPIQPREERVPDRDRFDRGERPERGGEERPQRVPRARREEAAETAAAKQ